MVASYGEGVCMQHNDMHPGNRSGPQHATYHRLKYRGLLVRMYAPRLVNPDHCSHIRATCVSKAAWKRCRHKHRRLLHMRTASRTWFLHNIINKSRIVRFTHSRRCREDMRPQGAGTFLRTKTGHEMMKTRVWVRGIISPKLRRTPC